MSYLDLEEVFWWTVDLLKGLLARIWHSLHFGGCVCGRVPFSRVSRLTWS